MTRHIRQQLARKATVTVSLADLFSGEDTGPKWVMVTREGDFPGYLGGLRPFVFKKADLEQMVANIKANPAFTVDAAGVGNGQVIPWDFNHASEADPVTGELPVTGAPAQGWTMDMEVRDGPDGKAQLWALTQFIGVALTYVKAGQYLWASVSVAFNAVNAETAQNVGALVTSIALTNTPVVEGMDKLTASNRGTVLPGQIQQIGLRRTWFEAARDPSDAISMMREMFSLPETAGAAEVMGSVATVQSWLDSGTAPLGTNPEELIGNMRVILNLPALTPQAAVVAEASNSIQALLQEQAAAAGVPGAIENQGGDGMVPEPPMGQIEAAKRRKDMDNMDELIKVLASLLGVRENEAAIKSAATELAQLRDSLTLAMGLSRDGANIILAAAKDGVDAKARLTGILEALGVSDPDAALNKIATQIESSAKLLEVMPELEGLQASAKEVEETAIESDVDQAIAAGHAGKNMRGALLLQRRTDPKEFAEAFPKVKASTQGTKQHLLRAVATAGATPLKVQASQDGSTVQLGGPDVIGGPDAINLANYQGRNTTARAKAYLSSTHPNWTSLDNKQQFLAAVALKAQPNVIDQAAG